MCVQLTATTGEPAVEWATREFAEKLGIADLFLFDDVPAGGVSSGGGQLMTCRDLARVGSLLVQGGKWADASGKEFQLLSKDYVRQQLSPSYPDVNAVRRRFETRAVSSSSFSWSCCTRLDLC